MIKNHKQLSKGSFDKLEDDKNEFVMECVSFFHYRNGTIHPEDGSAGKIDISPQQLRDIIAYTIITR